MRSFNITDFLFFFLMIRRPPRSTLFPTRRSSDLLSKLRLLTLGHAPRWRRRWQTSGQSRSEEHTSELQSREKLVCRLLLEKKKKKLNLILICISKKK